MKPDPLIKARKLFASQAGKASADALTPEQRRERARQAGLASGKARALKRSERSDAVSEG